jgi:phage tail-like protein
MPDPALNVFYRVSIDGLISLGTWTKVDGLGMEYQVTEYREGGVNGYMHKIIGPAKFTNLRLSRPVDITSPLLMTWLMSNQVAIKPQTMAVTAMTAAGDNITTWSLIGVVPVKWTGPTLDIMSNAVSTETLEVAYQEISLLGGLLGSIVGGLAGALDVSASVSF